MAGAGQLTPWSAPVLLNNEETTMTGQTDMKTFRIMPAQRFDLMPYSGTRYGFPIFDHPRGDPKAGYYVASWDKREKAIAAAHCLGYLPNVVVPIGYFVPGSQADFRVL